MRSWVISFTLMLVAGFGTAVLTGPIAIRLPYFAITLSALLFVLFLPAKNRVKSVATCLLLALAAFFYYQWVDGRNLSHLTWDGRLASEIDGQSVHVSGILASPVQVEGDKASFLLRSESVVWPDGSTQNVRERIRITVKLQKEAEQQTAARLRRGDPLALQGKLLLPEPARNFGGFDYRSYLHRQHIHWQLSVKGMATVEHNRKPAFGTDRLLSYMDLSRKRLGNVIADLFPANQAGYMKGLLIGDQNDVDPEQYRHYSNLGLTHLLAISGMHVAVFVGAMLWLLARFGMTREGAQTVVLGLLPFYVLLTGASPSVLRAGLMAALALYAARRGQLKDGLHLLSATGAILLVWNPYYLLDVGFQLSFLVTAGLILGVPAFSKLLPIADKRWNSAISVAVVAQAVSFPITIFYFNQFSLLSLAANLVLVPFVSFVITPLGTVAMIIGLVSVSAAKPLGWLTAFLNDWGFRGVEWLDQVSIFRLIWPAPPLWQVLVCYLLGAVLLAGLSRRKDAARLAAQGIRLPDFSGRGRRLLTDGWVLAASGTLLVVLLAFSFMPNLLHNAGTVSVLDVGQGDSIWIHTPGNKNILIDGGGTLTFRKPGEQWKIALDPFDVGDDVIVPLLKKRGVRQLDALLITHEDEDHIGGLPAIVDQIPVKRILFNGTLKASDAAIKLFEAAIEKDIPLIPVGEGDSWQVDKSTTLYFLQPAKTAEVTPSKEQNGKSVVTLMEMYKRTFLFTGDMEAEEEAQLMYRLEESRITMAAVGRPLDFLKTAHHGSKTSTTAEWLAYWQPKIAAISVGENNLYGHPTPVVLDRLNDSGVVTFRTDKQGEIRARVTPSGKLVLETKIK